jgi:hypothetical protein
MAAQAAFRAARRELNELWVQVEALELQSWSGLLDHARQHCFELCDAAVDYATPTIASTVILGAAVVWVAWRLVRPQTAREVLEEYEDEMQVHVVWLDQHPMLGTADEKSIGLTRSKVLSAAPRCELPDPDGMARAAMARVLQLRNSLAALTGSETERGLLVWQEFLLPVVLDAQVINEVLDDIHGANNVLLSRRHELRCLLCLLWSIIMPCTPSLRWGSVAWLQAEVGHPPHELRVHSSDEYARDATDEEDLATKREQFEQSQHMFFEQIARLLRLVLPLSNTVLGIREEDRIIMWRGFKDFILIVRHSLGGEGTLRRMPTTRSESDRGRWEVDDCPAKRATQAPWRYFEIWDDCSPWYIRGMESVEETPDLIDHVQAYNASINPDPEPNPEPEQLR